MGIFCSVCCPVNEKVIKIDKSLREKQNQFEGTFKTDLKHSMTPSLTPSLSEAKNYIIPSEEYPNEDSVFKERGFVRDINPKVIGKGGFGTVYELKSIKDNQLLVYKVIDLFYTHHEDRDEKKLQDVKHEIYTLGTVSHKNIVKLFDTFFINNKSFIVMERAVSSLDIEFQFGTPLLSEIQIKGYFSQIVLALSHLHQTHGIAHKDLKLPNILVFEGNGKKVLKLSDFGLSRIALTESRVIRVSKAEGTLQYFSPEIMRIHIIKRFTRLQRRGETIDLDIGRLGRLITVDPFCADIYALGVCLYKMFTQGFPYDSNKFDVKVWYNVFFKQMDRQYNKFNRDISLELKDLIDSMFESNYKKRLDIIEIQRHRWLKGLCN